MWQFVKRYAKGSAGLYRIEARYDGGPWFNITDSAHVSRINKMLENKAALRALAEKVYSQRFS